MLTQYAGIFLFLVVGALVPLAALATNWLIRPKKPNKVKLETYECGVEPIGETWVQFKANYFLYALVFVAFDIETVFLYPWAVVFQSLGLFAFIEMIIFIAILVLVFWYAWKEGALEWK